MFTVEDFYLFLERITPYIIDFLWRFLGALLILLVGYIIALIIKIFVIKIAKACKIDKALARLGYGENLRRANISIKKTGSQVLGSIAKWIVIFTAFMFAVEHLEWIRLYDILYRIVIFLPSIFIAVVAFFFALIIGDFIEKLVSFKAQAARISYYAFLASFVKWVFLIFVFSIILSEIGIGETIFPLLLQAFAIGIVIALAIAIGLAFGLGGKEAAAKFLEKFRNKK